ncbi:amino acid adenylation, partial [Aureobasidium pullulans EXF-150]
LEMLSSQDLETIWGWNSLVPPSIHGNVHGAIEINVQKTPWAPAVCAWDGQFTYEDIWELSDRLFHRLAQYGCEPGQIVPICFEKTKWTIVAILAVLKTGAAFVLLDPSLPRSRLRLITEKISASVLLSSLQTASLGKSLLENTIILDPTVLLGAELGPNCISSGSHQCDRLYVSFTSGSSGNPKGVVITHANYCAAMWYRIKALSLGPHSRVFNFASYGFDVGIEDMLATLMAGGCVCVPSEDERMNDILGAINRLEANSADLTPSMMHLLSPEAVPSLRVLKLAGESLTSANVLKWADRTTLFNAYGPTECTVYCTVNRVTSLETEPSNIGRGLGASTWIVDPDNHNRLTAVGETGELLIEGPLVSPGYLGEDEMTAVAFIHDPIWLTRGFGTHKGRRGRLYKTGDLVAYDKDGTIKFKGRKDTQIKIRGQRVELGEIEHHLLEHLPRGVQVVVEAIQPLDNSSSPTIAAFLLIPGSERADDILCDTIPEPLKAEILALKPRLSATMPDYMLPTAYIPVARFPTTASWKTDRKELRKIGSALSRREISAFVAYRDVIDSERLFNEDAIRGMWAELLRVEPRDIERTDDFFWLGATSITAMQLTVMARKQGIPLTVAQVLRHPRLIDLARITVDIPPAIPTRYDPFSSVNISNIDRHLENHVLPALAIDRADLEDLAEATDYQVAKLSTGLTSTRGTTNYIILDFQEPVSHDRLEAACMKVVTHIPVLRTVFLVHQRRVLQATTKHFRGSFACRRVLSSLEATTNEVIELDMHHEVDPGRNMVKFWFLGGNGRTRRIILRLSQAYYDGPTLIKIVKTLRAAYLNERLPPVINFTEYMYWMRRENLSNEAEQYWRQLLAGSVVTKMVNYSKPSYKNVLDGAVNQIVQTSHFQGCGLTMGTVIKAAWALVLRELSGKSDVVYGFTTWGRNAPFPTISDVVGPCLDTMPTRVKFRTNMTPAELMASVQEQTIAALPFENFGYQKLVERCTSWPRWERLSSIVMYQNLGEDVDQMSLGDNMILSRRAVRPPSDRADIAVYTKPHDLGTFIEINSCNTSLPPHYARLLLQRMCHFIEYLTANHGANSSLPPIVHADRPAIPFVLETSKTENQSPPARSSNTQESSSHVMKLVIEAWKSIIACSDEETRAYEAKDVPFYDIWGTLTAAWGFADFYRRAGYVTSMEAMIDNPTIASQAAVLFSSSYDAECLLPWS